ncbi:hypothetical protein GCM10007350_36030 [Jeongeupia chitinilytica]|uniref:Uncharacterized protein n=1 Tax=Jeongeupia chitinilytica TaxID=1041641 RepID=A0ABQ3H644_9NEIS|nr:hypothetical protein GCM10007350_36030 [Jeongeupia chitinilytica]
MADSVFVPGRAFTLPPSAGAITAFPSVTIAYRDKGMRFSVGFLLAPSAAGAGRSRKKARNSGPFAVGASVSVR